MEDGSFKQTAEGWVFQPLVLFAPTETYLIDDQLKTRLAADIRLMWRINTVAIFVGTFIATGLFYGGRPFIEWLAVGAIGVLVGLTACAYAALQIRRRVSGMTPINATITPGDVIKTEASNSTYWSLIIGILLSALGFVNSAYELATGFNLWPLLGAIAWLVLMVFCVVLFVIKRRGLRKNPTTK